MIATHPRIYLERMCFFAKQNSAGNSRGGGLSEGAMAGGWGAASVDGEWMVDGSPAIPAIIPTHPWICTGGRPESRRIQVQMMGLEETMCSPSEGCEAYLDFGVGGALLQPTGPNPLYHRED